MRVWHDLRLRCLRDLGHLMRAGRGGRQLWVPPCEAQLSAPCQPCEVLASCAVQAGTSCVSALRSRPSIWGDDTH
uniref:Uncharacterized protein n=1 Tax=Rhinopithecus roxellana TaxID=61622 RepID=A0A2K6QL64_RHIRO